MEAKREERKEEREHASKASLVVCTSPNPRYNRLVARLHKLGSSRLGARCELDDASAGQADLVVLAAPDEPPSDETVSALRRHLSRGGAALLLTGHSLEARDPEAFGRLARLTAEYGVTLRGDEAVVRTAFHRQYLHPKEVQVEGAAVAPLDGVGSVVHPFGHTLAVQSPAVPLLSSRRLAFPANRPLAALGAGGRLAVLASAQALDDTYIDRDDNSALASALARLVLEGGDDAGVPPPRVDEDAPEYAPAAVEAPDIEALAERVRPCLQEPEEVPSDFTRLFDHRMFSYETSLIPEAVRLYRRLGVKHQPLDLIPPEFSSVHPPLQPAVFLPAVRELPAPSLELFDLDDEFASEASRLAQLANKCAAPADLPFFVSQAGRVLGVQKDGEPDDANPKVVLERIMRALVEYKKMG